MQHHCYYYFSARMSSSTNAKHHVVVALHYKSGHDERNKGECHCSYLIMLQATSVHCTYELFLFVHHMQRLGDAELPSVLHSPNCLQFYSPNCLHHFYSLCNTRISLEAWYLAVFLLPAIRARRLQGPLKLTVPQGDNGSPRWY